MPLCPCSAPAVHAASFQSAARALHGQRTPCANATAGRGVGGWGLWRLGLGPVAGFAARWVHGQASGVLLAFSCRGRRAAAVAAAVADRGCSLLQHAALLQQQWRAQVQQPWRAQARPAALQPPCTQCRGASSGLVSRPAVSFLPPATAHRVLLQARRLAVRAASCGGCRCGLGHPLPWTPNPRPPPPRAPSHRPVCTPSGWTPRLVQCPVSSLRCHSCCRSAGQSSSRREMGRGGRRLVGSVLMGR